MASEMPVVLKVPDDRGILTMHSELKAHPDYFTREIIQLADNVYMAFGFAASNVYMIVGDDGVIIIDTTETTAAATNILAEFRKITVICRSRRLS